MFFTRTTVKKDNDNFFSASIFNCEQTSYIYSTQISNA